MATTFDPIGTTRDVFMVESTLKKTKIVNRVRWELWECFDGRGIVRLVDADTGYGVTCVRYPTMDRAEESYAKDGSRAKAVA